MASTENQQMTNRPVHMCACACACAMHSFLRQSFVLGYYFEFTIAFRHSFKIGALRRTQPHRSAWQMQTSDAIVGWIHDKEWCACVCVCILPKRTHTMRLHTQWLSVRGCIEIQIYILFHHQHWINNNLQFSNFLLMCSTFMRPHYIFFLQRILCIWLHIAASFECIFLISVLIRKWQEGFNMLSAVKMCFFSSLSLSVTFKQSFFYDDIQIDASALSIGFPSSSSSMRLTISILA